MRALSLKTLRWIPFLLAAAAWADEAADRAAIQKVVIAFNHPHERAGVLAKDANLSSLARYAGPETSQVLFESHDVRFVTPDVAVVDASGSQYGSLILKHSMAAIFVMRREGAAWKVVIFRY
jgi:hypothetical protein